MTDSLETALGKLNLKQRVFALALTNPDNPCFGNQTRSAHKAYGYQDQAAAVKGSKLVRNTKVKVAISLLLERNGIGLRDRVATLASAARGELTSETIYRDRDGNIMKRVVTGLDPLRAIDIVNRMDGTYQRAEKYVQEGQGDMVKFLRDKSKAIMSN